VLLAQPKFIENKVLVLLTGSSILVNVVVSFLHGFPLESWPASPTPSAESWCGVRDRLGVIILVRA